MSDFVDIYDAANSWYSGYQNTVPTMKEDPGSAFFGLGANAIDFAHSAAQEGAEKFGDLRSAAALATPIISMGIRIMTVMSNMTGFEGPERGDRYGRGADAFASVSDDLDGTRSPDSWDGSSSKAYSDRHREQQERAQLMAKTDAEIKEVLDEEALQIKDTRNQISRQISELTYLIPVALAAKLWNVPPGSGEIASQAIQWAGFAKTVPIATQRMYRMVSDSSHNATLIRRAGATYDRIAAEAQAQ